MGQGHFSHVDAACVFSVHSSLIYIHHLDLIVECCCTCPNFRLDGLDNTQVIMENSCWMINYSVSPGAQLSSQKQFSQKRIVICQGWHSFASKPWKSVPWSTCRGLPNAQYLTSLGHRCFLHQWVFWVPVAGQLDKSLVSPTKSCFSGPSTQLASFWITCNKNQVYVLPSFYVHGFPFLKFGEARCSNLFFTLKKISWHIPDD